MRAISSIHRVFRSEPPATTRFGLTRRVRNVGQMSVGPSHSFVQRYLVVSEEISKVDLQPTQSCNDQHYREYHYYTSGDPTIACRPDPAAWPGKSAGCPCWSPSPDATGSAGLDRRVRGSPTLHMIGQKVMQDAIKIRALTWCGKNNSSLRNCLAISRRILRSQRMEFILIRSG